MRPFFFACLFSTFVSFGGIAGIPEAEFAKPSTANRPETYFFFFGGNIAAPGITADLEAVKAAGISGIKLFNGNSGRGAWLGVPNQVACLSPEWDALVGHFGNECERLGLRMAMQVCPGWAMAGGPWIKPENAMRHLAMSRTDVEGGRMVRVKLPQPPRTDAGWQDWRDIAVVAFPAPDGDWAEPLAPASVTGTVKGDWNAWMRGRGAMQIPADATTQITYEFAQPVTVRTLEMPSVKSLASVTQTFEPRTTVSLKADGATLVEETALPPSSWQDGRTFSLACRETTARRFVLTVKNRHPVSLRTVRLLSAAKKDNWEGEACWTLRSLLHRMPPEQSKSAYVPSASVVNLSPRMAQDGTLSWEAPAGRWAVLRIGHVNTGVKNSPAPPEGTGFECDKFSTKAADVQFDAYIGRLTAEKAPLQGKLRAMLMDSWECSQQTWTPGLETIFSSRQGYDLFTWIPAVFGYVLDSPDDTARFLDDWRVLISDLISDNFFGHMAARARERGMEVEFEAAFGNSIPGDIMKYYKYADTPMCEFWQPAKSFNFTPVKPIISAAHLYGKRGVGAEAFTSFRVTWDETLRDFKHNANMNLAEGISHFVFHTFTHNPQSPWLPPGTSFGGRGIGAPFVRGQSWWRHMPAFTDYFARCQAMLEAGSPVSDVLWYLGDECDGRPDHYAPFPAGYKYDYCNPDAFLTRITAQDGKWRTPDGTEFAVLWIPESRRMLPETMEHLLAGIWKGSTAAFASLPVEPATRKGGEKGEAQFRKARNALVALAAQTDCKVSDGRTGRLYAGKPLADVLLAEKKLPDVRGEGIVWNHRRSEEADWYFVAPASQGNGFDGTVTFRSTGRPEIWHPESGEKEQAAVLSASNRETRIALSLAPAQSCFVVFRRDTGTCVSKPYLDPAKFLKRAAKIELKTPWRIRFPEGWGMSVETTCDVLRPWKEIGTTDEARAFSGTAEYASGFTLDTLRTGTPVVLDLGCVESIAKVEVNGVEVGTVWSYPYRLEITRAVKPGFNQVRIDVTDTWFNRLAYDAGRPQEKRRTWTFRWPDKNAPLRDSGLLGPVSVRVGM
ncbi:MAG: hypothetical protein J5985_01080 [Kiritimatiellae bacterium]|nr:hypothetical protein [Kiritimatiellia bacterium]